MEDSESVQMLRKGIDAPGGVWADLGAGAGAVTLALRDLLGPEPMVYAVGWDAMRWRETRRRGGWRSRQATVHYKSADFTGSRTSRSSTGL